MNKVLVACDKFKGSYTAFDICTKLKMGLYPYLAVDEITIQPMADGGEGTLEILSAHLQLSQLEVPTFDALHRPIFTTFGLKEEVAYIETAKTCGLQLLKPSEYDIKRTSTYGIGLMIQHAINQNCKTIHLFLGGSATNDGGCGMAVALGYNFYDKYGRTFLPNGGTLSNISKIVRPQPTWDKINFFVWTDVSIPMLGEKGCSKMFSSQKGASLTDMEMLEQGMDHLTNLFTTIGSKKAISSLACSGAAGGLAGGCKAFLQAKIGSGIDFIMEQTSLEEKIKTSNYVITGEGKLDQQSLQGKVVSGITNLCQKYGKNCIVVCGSHTLTYEEIFLLGNPTIFELKTPNSSVAETMAISDHRVQAIAKEIGLELSKK